MEGDERQDFLVNRQHHPSSEAAIFLENRVSIPGEQAPVFVERLNRVEYLEEAINQRNISVELWRQANDEKDQLFALMEQELHLESSNARSTIDSFKMVKHAEEDIQDDDVSRPAWSQLRRLSKLVTAPPWRGLWFEAAGHYAKVEDAVLEALAEIPEIIDNARRYIDLYSKSRDQRLEARTFDLYLSILKALTHVMRFFADSSLRKIYQPLLKQSAYKTDLLTSLENIKIQAARVKEEANQCMQRRLMDIDQSILTHGNMLMDTNQTSSQALQILQNIHRFLVNSTISHPSTEQPGPRVIELGQPTLREHKNEVEWLPRRHAKEGRTVRSEMQATELISLIQCDSEVVSKDIDLCLTLGGALEERQMAKAAQLIQDETFKAYMTETPLPSPLLINGNEDLSCAEGLSPLSLVAARLARIAQQNEYTFVAAYFCAEHRPYGNDSPTPVLVGMMSSLIDQLVKQMVDKGLAIDLSFLDERHLRSLKELKLKTLCTVFEGLINQILPGNILFCVLDEVSLYETGSVRHDADAVLRRLTRLTRHENGIIFKLIVTCRGRMLDGSKYFLGHILNMDQSVEADDSSTWKIANMSI